MGLKFKALLKSPWVFHLSTGSCNNCDIEILDCLTPRFDIERFGMLLAGSIKHADVLLITGSGNRQSVIRLKRFCCLYKCLEFGKNNQKATKLLV